MTNPLIKQLQESVGVTADGLYGAETHREVMKAIGRSVAPAPVSRAIGDAGLALIKEFEGLSLKAYPDPATGGEPITIGYGHTGGVKLGDEISESKAAQLLFADTKRFSDEVAAKAPVATQNQFDAMVSLAYNVGVANFGSSTLLKKHNAGDYTGAQNEFVRWNRAAGKVMAGLTRRREAEAALYGKA